MRFLICISIHEIYDFNCISIGQVTCLQIYSDSIFLAIIFIFVCVYKFRFDNFQFSSRAGQPFHAVMWIDNNDDTQTNPFMLKVSFMITKYKQRSSIEIESDMVLYYFMCKLEFMKI